MQKRLLCALAAVVLIVPLAAEARQPKGPFFMLVNADGTRAHSGGNIFVDRGIGEPVGAYDVSVDNGGFGIQICVAVASPAEGAVGTIGIEAASNGTYFRVWTTAGGGAALIDLPFYIVVHCPKFKRGD